MNFNENVISVSVIIPCYRCAATIGRAVLSVVNQTIKPAELILVDDSSDDETLAMLVFFQRKYGSDWIKIITLSSNKGVSAARNAGWNQSIYEYIAFLDADDYWLPDKLFVQTQFMETSSAFLSFTDYQKSYYQVILHPF